MYRTPANLIYGRTGEFVSHQNVKTTMGFSWCKSSQAWRGAGGQTDRGQLGRASFAASLGLPCVDSELARLCSRGAE